ncbi:MAG TPA: chlorite dismutase family protein [Acidimicrobiales bacterium]|nr:chlorite dismutase family protein [Acidimicrobiales bacterium]
MQEPLTPSSGWCVLHLFCRPTPFIDPEAIIAAVKACQADDHQVITVGILGHKADLGFMALGPDLWRLRQLQSQLTSAGLDLVDSYVSLTEVSEYAKGVPEELKQLRRYPQLPPEGKRAWCFYPMSKRRNVGQNWYTLPYAEREQLMRGHGKTGRTFAGRVLQLITGSTGLDDWEWGVTLFAERPDDLKDVVYTMRFDEASATYAEFGPFFTGVVAPIDELVVELGLTS